MAVQVDRRSAPNGVIRASLPSLTAAGMAGRSIKIFSVEGNPICDDTKCQLTQDRISQRMYEFVTKIYEFSWRVFNLKGVDGKGMIPSFIIHSDIDNAMWSPPSSCRINSKGCFEFDDKYVDLESVAHEYMHAVVYHMFPLGDSQQAGALDESMSDIFASMFKQYYHKQTTKQADWRVDKERVLSNPVNMASFKFLRANEVPSDENDDGHVHDNSLIPSYAFVLAATNLIGHSWEHIGQIWFQAMQQAKPEENFASFAFKTVALVEKQWQGYPGAIKAVKDAWVNVGVLKYEVQYPSYPYQQDYCKCVIS